jgi:hypothetical protein
MRGVIWQFQWCEDHEQSALQSLMVIWPTMTDSQRRYSLRQLASMREGNSLHPYAYQRLLTIAEGITSADERMRDMNQPPLEAQ